MRGTGSRCPASTPAGPDERDVLADQRRPSPRRARGEVRDPVGVDRLRAAERQPDAVRDHRDAPFPQSPPLEADLR